MSAEKIILYREMRLLSLCIFFVLVEPCFIAINGQRDRDSLDNVLSQTEKLSEKLEILQSVASENKGKPDELYYLKRLLDISAQAESKETYYTTLVQLADYYSYTSQLDSLMNCLSLADSMAKDDKEVPRALFDIQNHICQYHIVNGDYEIAMNEAISLNMKAEKTGNKKDIVSTNVSIGLIYLFISRYDEAIPFFENSLSLMEEIEDINVNFQLSVMSYLAYVSFRAGDFEKMKQTMERYNSVLVKKAPRQKEKFCMLYSYYTNYYVVMGEKDKAKETAKKATNFMSEDYDLGYTSVYYLAMARFYHLMSDYDEALYFVNKAFEVDPCAEVLEVKMGILEKSGKLEEALNTCGEAVKLMSDQSIATYSRQMDRLHIQHTLNDQARQAQLLQDQKMKIAQNQKLLIAFFVFVCILIVLVFIMISYSLKIRRLKNALEQERNILEESTEDLRLAKERAEKANQMKTQFVANVSHEIRTPLNAIVGFSALLSDAEEDEQAEYINVVNENTELLLKLINDVLDLSRLESDNLVLDISQVNLDGCCQDALETVRHKVNQGVKLTFTHPDEPFVLATDPTRVLQLLVNLLMNATKYTEEGEINLSYKLDEASKQIEFAVTDTGCGIPLDKQEIIFNRFEKVDDFRQGAGLGLSICYEIAKCLGGSIFVDSSYTTGARFIFRLPIGG